MTLSAALVLLAVLLLHGGRLLRRRRLVSAGLPLSAHQALQLEDLAGVGGALR